MWVRMEIDIRKLQSLNITTGRARRIIEDGAGLAAERAATKIETAARLGATRLPKRGGLAREVASSKFGRKRRRMPGGGVSIEVTATGRYDLQGIDEGLVIHPTYGRRPWTEQAVPAGWFSDSFEKVEDDLVNEVESLIFKAISIIR